MGAVAPTAAKKVASVNVALASLCIFCRARPYVVERSLCLAHITHAHLFS